MYSTTAKVSFILALFGIALGATVVKPELANSDPFPHFETDEVFTCGGVLREASEQILYKPFRQVDANERCVWIVGVPEASSYRVRLLYAGHEPSSRNLNVAGVNWYPHVDLVYPRELSSSWSSIPNSNSLVITFHTSNETTTGFALEYEVVERGTSTSKNSTFSIVDANTHFIKHPQGRDTYDNAEASIFALPPLNNVQVEGHSRQVIYSRLGMEPGCYDKLSVFHFNPASNRYNLQGNICDSTQVELIKSTDVSLLIFKSDSSITRAGFNLAFTSCSA